MSGWRTTCAAAVLALAAYGCNTQGTPEPGTDEAPGTDTAAPDDATGTAGEESGTVRLAEITAEPADYFGKTVTVEADVEEVFGPQAFALDEDAPLTGGVDNDVLVLSPKAGSLADIDDQWLNNRVRVTGVVGGMSVVEIEREIGWDLSPELEIELERRGAVLVAKSIERVSQ